MQTQLDAQKTHQKENKAYQYLEPPRRLQNKLHIKTQSILSFAEFPNFIESFANFLQPLDKANDSIYYANRKPRHLIGESLTNLFKSHIYKVHERLVDGNNESFASTQLGQNFSINNSIQRMQTANNILQFESRFESGNLAYAALCPKMEKTYNLALQRDYNSKSITTQWFYFKVSNKKNLGSFTFNIVNYVKPFSMFKSGMKPCVYSSKKGVGWERDGINIQYKKNSIKHAQGSNYYTLAFTYNFRFVDDQVYFAYSFPYTYSKLQNFLDEIEKKHNDKLKRKVIAKTLGNNVVEVVSITNPQYSNKKVLIISGRVHPGQTIASYSIEGCIKFLVSNHQDAEKLRAQFIIKIIPMLNPDGVINGNYRTSLSGQDLNRQWKTPSKSLHPEIWSTKKYLLQIENKKLYIDFHGHSKKKDSFMYGCSNSKNIFLAKQFPYVLSKKSIHFNYYACNFTTPKSKEGTSRIVMWKSGGIEHSYTFQLSFCGPKKEKNHFSIKDYLQIGIQLCKNIKSFFFSRFLQLQINEDIQDDCDQLYENEQLLQIGNQETNGSSSQLDDEVVKPYQIQIKLRPPSPKKIKRKERQKEESLPKNAKVLQLIQGCIVNKINPRKRISSRTQEEVEKSRQLLKERKKSQEREECYKSRQQYLAAKVSVQKVQILETNQRKRQALMNASCYGFASEKSSILPYHSRSGFYENIHHSQEKKVAVEDHPKQDQSFGILLPNVGKGNYKKYERYKKADYINQMSSYVDKFNTATTARNNEKSFRMANVQSKTRQISLTERIKERTRK